MKKTLVAGLFAGLALSSATVAYALQDETPSVRDLGVVQKPVYDWAPAVAKYRVSTWVDKPLGIYRIGDEVRIGVRSNLPGYVTIVNIGTTGKTTVLFPNAIHRTNRIAAGQTLMLPRPGAGWGIQTQGPGGVEVIKVFVSSSPRALFAGGKFRPVGPFREYDGTGEDMVRDLGVIVKEEPRATWGSATTLFRVRED